MPSTVITSIWSALSEPAAPLVLISADTTETRTTTSTVHQPSPRVAWPIM